MQKSELIHEIKNISIFKKFGEDFFEAFIPHLKINDYSEGHHIITEGDAGRDMYLLLEGNVRVVKKTLSGDKYTAAVLKAEMGIFFGEVGLLTEEKRTASIIGETKIKLASIDAVSFQKFITEYPLFGAQLLFEIGASVCGRLNKANKDTIILYEALMGEISTTNLGVNLAT